MKQLIVLCLIALAVQAKVHDFHAESNFICTLCKETMTLIKNKDLKSLQYVIQQYPALEERLLQLNENQPTEQSCINAGLCENTLNTVLNNEDLREIDASLIEKVNSNPQSTWKAGENAKFKGMTIADIKKMMGTVVDSKWTYKGAPKKLTSNLKVALPASFDARTQWPQCTVIGHIRDQSNCGSCWAHGTTEAYNDRLCIKSGFNTLLSVADTTACCGFFSCFSQGCNGGQIGTPWSWFTRTGVVTGGDFGDTTTCYPYTMQKCAHHVTSSLPDCSTVQENDPTCGSSCPGNSASYSNDKHKASSSYGLSSTDSIKQDLVQYGPVTAAFTVYEDFLNYKSGVYKHTTGSALGGHAVKIIGYGNENGTDYWLVANSWNETWGDNGTFKIAFGDCGIDSQVHAGLA